MVRFFAFMFIGYAALSSVFSAPTPASLSSSIQSNSEFTENLLTQELSTQISLESLANPSKPFHLPPYQLTEKDVDSVGKPREFTDMQIPSKTTGSENANDSNIPQSVKKKTHSIIKISVAKKIANLRKKKYRTEKLNSVEQPSSKNIDINLKEKSDNILPAILERGQESDLTLTITKPEKSLSNSEEEDISSSLKNSDSLPSEIYILNPKEESIFHPQSFKKYTEFIDTPIEPIPDLRDFSHYPNGDLTDELAKIPPPFYPKEYGVPERTEHELFPSSIFERELRISFL